MNNCRLQLSDNSGLTGNSLLSVCNPLLPCGPNRAAADYHGFSTAPGAIAQLGERLHGMQEVGGSSPPGSTNPIGIRLAAE